MDSVLVDTDVFSFLFRQDTRAGAYARDVEGKRLCLSFMSVAELLRWAVTRRWGEARRQSLHAVLRRYVILPYDFEMARTWATIAAERARTGKPISCGDCWIAASAVRHGLPLVTHNQGDFSHITGLTVISHSQAP